MKTIAFAAAAMIAGAAAFAPASAQPYPGKRPPPPMPPHRVCVVPPLPPLPPHTNIFNYSKRHHARCHAASWRLHHYERCAASDGRLSPREQRTIAELRSELRRDGRGWRWRG